MSEGPAVESRYVENIADKARDLTILGEDEKPNRTEESQLVRTASVPPGWLHYSSAEKNERITKKINELCENKLYNEIDYHSLLKMCDGTRLNDENQECIKWIKLINECK